MILNNFLLGLTTTKGSDWRGKIEETKKLNIKEIALFPTCLELKDRKILYELLKDTPVKSIPHVHIREQDFEPWEIKYFVENYKTIFFNIHDEADLSLLDKFSDYKNHLYLENSGRMLSNFEETLDKIEGLCVDFAHLDFSRRTEYSNYFKMIALIKKYPIGCCHISAQVKRAINHNGHHFNDLAEFDYLENYKNLIPNIASIELENTLEEQMVARKYIEKIIAE